MVVHPFVNSPSGTGTDVEAGIIEDAKARQRRQRRIAAVVLALAGIALGAIFGFGGGNGGGGSGGGSSPPSGSGGSANPLASSPGYSAAPHSQAGAFENSQFVCPKAAPNRYLPRQAGCVSVKHADVDGDGRTDLVILYANLSSQMIGSDYVPRAWTLEVARAAGPVDRIQIERGDQHPFLLRMANVNDVAGAEIFLQPDEISSGSPVNIYSYGDGALRRAGQFFAGGDSADRERFSCETKAPARVTQQTMVLLGPTIYGRWRWTTTTYLWQGPSLKRARQHTIVRTGLPSIGATAFGGGCGTPLGLTGDQ